MTGFDGPDLWERELAKENARTRRYGRTATVVVAEIVGLVELAGDLGTAAALDALRDTCRAMSREVRSSDYIARIGEARFGFLLVESNEIDAINFIDRVRVAFEGEIGPARQLRLAFGWASPKSLESVGDARAAATERLAVDVRKTTARREVAAPFDDRHRDPWWDLEGVAAATARRRQAMRARLAFALSVVADVAVAATWVAQLSGVVRVPILL